MTIPFPKWLDSWKGDLLVATAIITILWWAIRHDYLIVSASR